MKTLKSMNFGPRGWLLLVYQLTAFVAMSAFTNFPMNMLADMYGGAQKVSSLYTTAMLIAIVIQLIVSLFIGKIKSVKLMSNIFGILTMIFALLIMVIPPSMLGAWQACYFMVALFSPIYCTFTVGMLVGQWFPTKKGSFMGIATLAFPVVNGTMGAFAAAVFANGMPNVARGFMPYFILCVIGLVIGIVAIKDYPEQCGAYRDNNKDLTPEVAKAMMLQEIENKKTSVWKTGSTLTSRDFWFITIPMGALLMCAVGMMTQTSAIIGSYGAAMDKFGGFAGVMFLIMVFGIIGSFVIGLIDTAIGTKKAVILSCVIMLISGILGMMDNATCIFLALVLLAIFMGASSNFTVSAAAQYWRREDFTSVFGCVNPIANIIQAVGPAMIAILMGVKGTVGVFGMVAVFGVISIILGLLFSPKHVKVVDDKRREKAGKPLDDALVGRK